MILVYYHSNVNIICNRSLLVKGPARFSLNKVVIDAANSCYSADFHAMRQHFLSLTFNGTFVVQNLALTCPPIILMFLPLLIAMMTQSAFTEVCRSKVLKQKNVEPHFMFRKLQCHSLLNVLLFYQNRLLHTV